MTLPRLRESLTLVLLALLPFHAFLVTVLTKLIAGSNRAPLPVLALWKEALLVVVLVTACAEMFRKRSVIRVDVIDAIIATLTGLAATLFFVNDQSFGTFALGAKYDLLPLIAFLILRRVDWSQTFQASLVKMFIAVGCIVALYGIIAEFLPLRFFVWLGYSDLHSLYVANAPLAPFQEIEGGLMRRAQSVMSGPNQLGLWLLIPIGCLLGSYSFRKDIRRKAEDGRRWRSFLLMSYIFCLTSLFLSFSRAAWIAAAVMMIFAFVRSTSVLHCRKLCAVVLGFLACFGIAVALMFPTVFFRLQSSSDHIRKPVEAVRLMLAHPFGLGLGTAGPASNRFSDTCVQLPAGSDASWAKDRQDLCVFIDSVQIQPIGRSCSCPLLTENWYLQIGIELGVLGFMLYILLFAMILLRLVQSLKLKVESDAEKLFTFHFPLLTFLGLSIAALFLHAFEDSAVAYTVWILLSTPIPKAAK